MLRRGTIKTARSVLPSATAILTVTPGFGDDEFGRIIRPDERFTDQHRVEPRGGHAVGIGDRPDCALGDGNDVSRRRQRSRQGFSTRSPRA